MEEAAAVSRLPHVRVVVEQTGREDEMHIEEELGDEFYECSTKDSLAAVTSLESYRTTTSGSNGWWPQGDADDSTGLSATSSTETNAGVNAWQSSTQTTASGGQGLAPDPSPQHYGPDQTWATAPQERDPRQWNPFLREDLVSSVEPASAVCVPSMQDSVIIQAVPPPTSLQQLSARTASPLGQGSPGPVQQGQLEIKERGASTEEHSACLDVQDDGGPSELSQIDVLSEAGNTAVPTSNSPFAQGLFSKENVCSNVMAEGHDNVGANLEAPEASLSLSELTLADPAFSSRCSSAKRMGSTVHVDVREGCGIYVCSSLKMERQASLRRKMALLHKADRQQPEERVVQDQTGGSSRDHETGDDANEGGVGDAIAHGDQVAEGGREPECEKGGISADELVGNADLGGARRVVHNSEGSQGQEVDKWRHRAADCFSGASHAGQVDQQMTSPGEAVASSTSAQGVPCNQADAVDPEAVRPMPEQNPQSSSKKFPLFGNSLSLGKPISLGGVPQATPEGTAEPDNDSSQTEGLPEEAFSDEGPLAKGESFKMPLVRTSSQSLGVSFRLGQTLVLTQSSVAKEVTPPQAPRPLKRDPSLDFCQLGVPLVARVDSIPPDKPRSSSSDMHITESSRTPGRPASPAVVMTSDSSQSPIALHSPGFGLPGRPATRPGLPRSMRPAPQLAVLGVGKAMTSPPVCTSRGRDGKTREKGEGEEDEDMHTPLEDTSQVSPRALQQRLNVAAESNGIVTPPSEPTVLTPEDSPRPEGGFGNLGPEFPPLHPPKAKMVVSPLQLACSDDAEEAAAKGFLKPPKPQLHGDSGGEGLRSEGSRDARREALSRKVKALGRRLQQEQEIQHSSAEGKRHPALPQSGWTHGSGEGNAGSRTGQPAFAEGNMSSEDELSAEEYEGNVMKAEEEDKDEFQNLEPMDLVHDPSVVASVQCLPVSTGMTLLGNPFTRRKATPSPSKGFAGVPDVARSTEALHGRRPSFLLEGSAPLWALSSRGQSIKKALRRVRSLRGSSSVAAMEAYMEAHGGSQEAHLQWAEEGEGQAKMRMQGTSERDGAFPMPSLGGENTSAQVQVKPGMADPAHCSQQGHEPPQHRALMESSRPNREGKGGTTGGLNLKASGEVLTGSITGLGRLSRKRAADQNVEPSEAHETTQEALGGCIQHTSQARHDSGQEEVTASISQFAVDPSNQGRKPTPRRTSSTHKRGHEKCKASAEHMCASMRTSQAGTSQRQPDSCTPQETDASRSPTLPHRSPVLSHSPPLSSRRLPHRPSSHSGNAGNPKPWSPRGVGPSSPGNTHGKGACDTPGTPRSPIAVPSILRKNTGESDDQGSTVDTQTGDSRGKRCVTWDPEINLVCPPGSEGNGPMNKAKGRGKSASSKQKQPGPKCSPAETKGGVPKGKGHGERQGECSPWDGQRCDPTKTSAIQGILWAHGLTGPLRGEVCL